MADEVEDVTILVNKLSQFSLPSISGTELEDVSACCLSFDVCCLFLLILLFQLIFFSLFDWLRTV